MHDVLYELGAVGIQSLPFFRRADTFISDTFAAELVCADLRLHIGKVPSGWQRDKQHPTPAGEGQSVIRGGVLITHGLHDRSVHGPPEFHDPGVRLPPSVHQRRELVLRQTHFNGPHRLQSADRAAVAEGQFCDLSLLPQVAIDPVLFHGNLEHLAGAGAVDVAALLENLLPPRLPGVPGDDAGLDGGEVGHQKLSAVLGNERGADQLGECVRHVLIQELHSVEVTGADKSAGLGEIRKMVLGQIL